MTAQLYRPRPALPLLRLPSQSFETAASRSRLAAVLARLAPRLPTLEEERCWQVQLPLTHVAIELDSPANNPPSELQLLNKPPGSPPASLATIATCLLATLLVYLLLRLCLAGELERWIGGQVQ